MDSRGTMKAACDNVGIKCVADKMGVSSSVLYNQMNEDKRIDLLKRFVDFCEATESDIPIKWACEKLGGVFVPNKEVSDEELGAVTTTYVSKSVKEFGDVITVMGEAIEDGVITENEALKIKKEWDELKTLLESFVHVCLNKRSEKLKRKMPF